MSISQLIDNRGELEYERAFHEGENDDEELTQFELYWESVGGVRAEYDMLLDAWEAGRHQMKDDVINEFEKQIRIRGLRTNTDVNIIHGIELVLDYLRRIG